MNNRNIDARFLRLNNSHYLFLFMLIALSLISVWYSSFFGRGETLVSVSLTIYFIVIFLCFILLKKEATFVHPFIFFVIWYELFKGVFSRFSIYINGAVEHRAVFGVGLDGNHVLIKHILLSTLFIISVFMGYFLTRRLKVYKYYFVGENKSNRKLFFVFIVSIISLYFVSKWAGGINSLLLQRGIARSERYLNQSDSGILVIAVRMLSYLCVAWLAVNFKSWRNPLFLVIFICSILMGFIVSGSRGSMVLPVIIALVIIFATNNFKSIPYFKLIFISLFMLFVLGLATEFRESSQGKSSVGEVQIDTNPLDKVISTLDTMSVYAVDGDGSFAILSKVPKYKEYLYGESYLSILFAPIPSALLPFDKPKAGGAHTAQVFYNTNENTIPPKHLGESFWNFSYFGVFFVGLVYGMVVGYFYRVLVKNNFHPFLLVIYVITIFRLEPTSDGFYAWIQTVVPVLLFLLYISGSPKRIAS